MKRLSMRPSDDEIRRLSLGINSNEVKEQQMQQIILSGRAITTDVTAKILNLNEREK